MSRSSEYINHPPYSEKDAAHDEFLKQKNGPDPVLEERKYKHFMESNSIDELRASMNNDVERATKIVDACYDADQERWNIHTYPSEYSLLSIGQQIAKRSIVLIATMIWADSFRGRPVDHSLKKIKEIKGGWRIQFDDKNYLEVYFAA